MATVSVRYIVNDIDAAISFYTRHLGFSVHMHPNDTFAMLTRDDLRLVGVGGKQVIADDPSGNPVELFEPTMPQARLSRT